MLRLATALALVTAMALPAVAKVPGLPIANEGSKLGECIQMGKWTTQGATKVYAKAGDTTTVVATQVNITPDREKDIMREWRSRLGAVEPAPPAKEASP